MLLGRERRQPRRTDILFLIIDLLKKPPLSLELKSFTAELNEIPISGSGFLNFDENH